MPGTTTQPVLGLNDRIRAAIPARPQRSPEDRLSDAEKWAHSVSQVPALAEAAILACLAKHYRPPLSDRMRASAQCLLQAAQGALQKDVDAIERILRSGGKT